MRVIENSFFSGWPHGDNAGRYAMLFTKNIEPRCLYCKLGKTLDKETTLCKKRGVTKPDSSCRAFRYDPLKRVPPRPVALDLSKLNEEDFTL